MSLLAVAEAAVKLGVSERRVRQMLAEGVLPGERIGRAWVIDSKAIRQLSKRRPEVGRPWKAQSVWAVLALADGHDIELSPVEHSRARRRLSGGLVNALGRLGARAERRDFYAHPSVLEHVARVPGVVRSGVSALREHHIDLVADGMLEAYMPASALLGLVDRFALEEGADRPNIILHVVDDAVWPFGPNVVVAPLPVVAVDLLESDDERSSRAGAELLERR
jgi:excisionase family DNA binding protein